MDSTIINLHGTTKEQVAQLIQMFKDRKISLDKLKEIVPLNADFIKELAGALRSEIDSGKEKFNLSIDALKLSLGLLGNALKDEKLKDSERELIYKEISKINDCLYDLAQTSEKNSFELKRMIIACLTFIFVILIGVASGGRIDLSNRM